MEFLFAAITLCYAVMPAYTYQVGVCPRVYELCTWGRRADPLSREWIQTLLVAGLSWFYELANLQPLKFNEDARPSTHLYFTLQCVLEMHIHVTVLRQVRVVGAA